MKKIIFLGLFLALIGGGVFYYNNYYFNAQSILNNSIFKEKNFSVEVKEVVSSDNKIKAYLLEDKSVPLVAINLGFKKMGNAYLKKNGVGLVAEGVFLDGAGNLDRKKLRKFMKEKGIKIGFDVGRDEAGISLSYVKDFENDAWNVLKDVIYKPHLKTEDINLIKEQIVVQRKSYEENPKSKLNKLISKEFFKSHPYGREIYPSDEELLNITDKDIRNYLKSYMAKDVISVGVAGSIDEAKVKEFLDEVLVNLEEKTKAEELPKFSPIYNNEVKVVNDEHSKQSFVLHISQGIKRLDKDFYPFYVADFIFGGSGLNSVLNKEMREKEGLTYGIYSYLSQSDGLDTWNVFYSATPTNMEKIEKKLNEEYQKFYENKISKDDLELAKSSLMSSFNLRFASLFNIAGQLQVMMAENLGRDFLEKRQDMIKDIKLEDVNRVISQKMSGKNRAIFVVNGKN